MGIIKPGLEAVLDSVWQLRRAEDSDDPNDPRFTSDGDDDSDDDDDDADDDTDDDSDDDDRSKPSKKSKKGKKDDEDDEDEGETYTQEEYDRVRTRMRNADRTAMQYKAENEKLKARIAKLEASKGKSKDTDDDGEESTPPAVDTAREEQLRQTRIENAFLRVAPNIKDRKGDMIVWHDPEDALAVAEKLHLLDDVLDTDGTVDRREMARALRELAKRKPHLVKPSSKASGKDDDDEEEDEEPVARPRKMNGRRRGETKTTDRAALANRFPALRRR